MKISLLINMKMPTVVGIFIFISRENFMLSCVEHAKSFITSRPDCLFQILNQNYVNGYMTRYVDTLLLIDQIPV